LWTPSKTWVFYGHILRQQREKNPDLGHFLAPKRISMISPS
jgi:hypothetical protein